MSIFSISLNWIFKRRYKHLIKSFDNSVDIQESIFKYLIDQGCNTLFGFDHNFKKIKNIEDFNKYVPISTYEQLFPYIDSMLRGEQNILWPNRIEWFSKSSGTTNDKSKYIPVSREALEQNHYKAGRDMLSIYLYNNPNSKLLRGKNIAIAGSIKNVKDLNIKCGDVSAVLMNNLPIWARIASTPDLKSNLLPDWEEKIKIICENCKNERVASITGIPTWTLTLIKTIIEKEGVEYIDQVWPHLEVFFHGGVSFAPYKRFLNKLAKKRINYFEVYNASEGFFCMQLDPEDDDMILLLNHGVFYEFIELEDFENNNFSNVKTIKGVEIGKIYAMIITTSAGLWRYVIGDTVEFTCLKPFKIKIVGRTKLFINTFGEELMIQNAEEAIYLACKKTSCSVENYTAGPCYFNDHFHGSHEWAIEFSKEPENLEEFITILDKKLKSLNSDYEAKRLKDIILGRPVITVLPKGFFYNWMKKRNKLGGQNKVPRLFNSRKYLDDIHMYL